MVKGELKMLARIIATIAVSIFGIALINIPLYYLPKPESLPETISFVIFLVLSCIGVAFTIITPCITKFWNI
jgi:hypothetical protein